MGTITVPSYKRSFAFDLGNSGFPSCTILQYSLKLSILHVEPQSIWQITGRADVLSVCKFFPRCSYCSHWVFHAKWTESSLSESSTMFTLVVFCVSVFFRCLQTRRKWFFILQFVQISPYAGQSCLSFLCLPPQYMQEITSVRFFLCFWLGYVMLCGRRFLKFAFSAI